MSTSQENLNLILGPILLGSLMSWGLFGVVVLQIYLYFQWYPKDRRMIKLLVLSLLILECADTAISTNATWLFMVSGWGNPATLMAAPWSFSVAIILTALTAYLAQIFFARRLWVFSKNVIVSGLIVAIAFAQFLAALAGASQVLASQLTDSMKLSTFDAFAVWLASSAACDILIAGGMIFYIRKSKSNTNIRSTRALLTRLINQSVQTGAFTACCALIQLGFFFGFTLNNLQDTPFFILGKLYSNTVLANLNSRQSLVNAGLYVPGEGTTNEGPAFTDPIDMSWLPNHDLESGLQGQLGVPPTDSGSSATPSIVPSTLLEGKNHHSKT